MLCLSISSDYSWLMNYDWLFSFVRFADCLNFTHAASQLHITQPALHTQIKKLGEDVGRPLYRRHGRSLSLTPEGKRLAAFGREVQARGEDVLAEVRGELQTGPVILASGHGAFQYLLDPAIQQFPKDRWQLRLVTQSGPEIIETVSEARAQLGVVAGSLPFGELEAMPLRKVRQVVVLPAQHRLRKRKRIRLSDLSGERFIVAPQGRPHRAMIDQAFAAAEVEWCVAVEATGWDLVLRFARYGLGLAIVNDFCEIPRGLLAVPLDGLPSTSYFLVTRSGPLSDGARWLHDRITRTTAG